MGRVKVFTTGMNKQISMEVIQPRLQDAVFIAAEKTPNIMIKLFSLLLQIPSQTNTCHYNRLTTTDSHDFHVSQ